MLQIYTGNGKGKTTAALGIALRAVGAGMRVLFAQFMKNVFTSEAEAVKLLGGGVVFRQFGSGDYIINTPTEKDFERARAGFAEVEDSVRSGRFDMIVADEICTALYYRLIDTERVLEFVKNCPPRTELVFTGRYACDTLINAADLVTEMREVKHFYSDGVSARKGIEF